MNLSILTCMRKHHLCQLSPRLKKPLSFAFALSNLSDMPTSLSSQNKKVTQSLCQRQKIQKTKQKESETQTEKVRCQALPLSKLAEETLTDGQLKGKSRRQIYQEHAGYIHWLFGHQPNNTKFLKVMIYARRVEECQEKTARSTKTLVKSSGEKKRKSPKNPGQSGTRRPLRANPSRPKKEDTISSEVDDAPFQRAPGPDPRADRSRCGSTKRRLPEPGHDRPDAANSDMQNQKVAQLDQRHRL